MEFNAQIENYLQEVEKLLIDIPVSQKSQYLVELRAEITAALSKEPNKSIDEVLSSLGSPVVAANKLRAKGGFTTRRNDGSVFKWMVIGCLGVTALFFVFILTVVLLFQPIIDIDGERGKVSLFGGMIDLDDTEGSFFIGNEEAFNTYWDNNPVVHVDEELDLVSLGVSTIEVVFSNGYIDVEKSNNNKLRWICDIRSRSGRAAGLVEETSEKVSLRLDQFQGSKCDILVPGGFNVNIRGANGKLEIDSLANPMDITVSNGNVSFEESRNTKYRYNIDVVNGMISDRGTKSHPDGVPISISVTNGRVKVEKD